MVKNAIDYEQHSSYFESYKKGQGWERHFISPEGIYKAVEGKISEDLSRLDVSLSLTIGRFNLLEKTFLYVKGENSKVASIKKDTHKVLHFKHSTSFLEKKSQTHQIQYGCGDTFLFYSNPCNEVIESQIIRSFEVSKDPKNLIEIVQNDLKKQRLLNDLTLIVLKISDEELAWPIHTSYATFRSKTAELDQVRHFAHELCIQAKGNREKLIFQLKLVLNEIFCNIIEHGYSSNPTGLIILKGMLDKEELTVEIMDQGLSFAPSGIPEPIFTGEAQRGFGLYIVEENVDQMIYTPKTEPNGWNHLQIRKKY